VGATLPAEAVAAAGQWFSVAVVADVAKLEEKIFQLLRRGRSAGDRRVVEGLRATWQGAIAAARVLDLSAQGCSLALSLTTPVADLLPGTILPALIIDRGDEVCLSDVDAEVRHIAVAEDGYRVGCALLPRPGAARPRRVVVHELAQRAGLIAAGLANGGMTLRLDGDTTSVSLAGGRVDLEQQLMELEGGAGAFSRFDVVHGSVELGGASLRFVSSVVSGQPLRIRLPRTIERVQQRATLRHRPKSGEAACIVSSPLQPDLHVEALVDLSANGLAFDFSPADALFVLGQVLPRVVLEVAGHVVEGRGRVRSLTTVAEGRSRCRVELELAEEGHLALAAALARLRFPGLEDGGGVPVDALFTAFRESGYLPREPSQLLLPSWQDVRTTFERLSKRTTPIFKAVVKREGEVVQGHVSVIRSYSATWNFQHFCALAGKQLGLTLSLGIADYLLQRADCEHFKIWFHAGNNFSTRVFAGFARRILDPETSDLRRFAHVLLDTTPAEPPRGVRVIEASGGDLAVVEQHFIRREVGVVLRADDLLRDRLELSTLGELYRSFGLERRRRVLLALMGDRPVGFALAEVSSPGLNLMEGLSSFRIHLFAEAAEKAEAVGRALLAELARVYREAGRQRALGLIEEDLVTSLAALGLPVRARSYCWTYHRVELARIFEDMQSGAASQRIGRGKKTPASRAGDRIR
jgi:hypothetical protein